MNIKILFMFELEVILKSTKKVVLTEHLENFLYNSSINFGKHSHI